MQLYITTRYVSILLIIMLCYGCNSSSKKTSETSGRKYINTIDSLGVITYLLKDSDYLIRTQLSGLHTEKVDTVISIREDDYAVPVKKDGYLLTIKFRVNNPNDKALIIPIPQYFALTANNDDFFAEETLFSKSCYCMIINSTNITDIENNELYKVAKAECGHHSDRYCMKFAPNETKEFIVRFDKPILASQKEVVLLAFDMHYKNAYGYEGRDVGLLLDTEKGKLKGTKDF